MAMKGQPLSTDDKIFGSIFMGVIGIGALVVAYQGVKYVAGVVGLASESKSAEMLDIDGVATRPLPFANMAMTNAQERSTANVTLNHLYGGVPNPSPSGMIDYLTGTPSFLQGAN